MKFRHQVVSCSLEISLWTLQTLCCFPLSLFCPGRPTASTELGRPKLDRAKFESSGLPLCSEKSSALRPQLQAPEMKGRVLLTHKLRHESWRRRSEAVLTSKHPRLQPTGILSGTEMSELDARTGCVCRRVQTLHKFHAKLTCWPPVCIGCSVPP